MHLKSDQTRISSIRGWAKIGKAKRDWNETYNAELNVNAMYALYVSHGKVSSYYSHCHIIGSK